MSIQSQFTPEQIQALVSGEQVSFSNKTNSSKVETPVATDSINPEQLATAFTPSTSISIAKQEKVTGVNVRSEAGEVVSKADQTIKPNFSKESDLERREAARKLKLEEEQAAKAQLAQQSDPTQLLNTLNGLRRIVEKQGREIAKLKKEQG